MKTIQPIGDKVLVKIAAFEKRTKSGIYLPDNVQKGTKFGKVVALGDDPELTKKVQVGDTVAMTSYAGNDLELDGQKYVIVQLNDILGVLREYEGVKKK